MFNPIKPSAKDAFGGVAIAMVIGYVLFNAQDFLRGEFYLDFTLIRNLLLMGAGVLTYGLWEHKKAS